MIEVEKRFTLTEEQIKEVLQDSELIGEKLVHDVYFDYPDFRLFKSKVRLRKRNNNFELKVGQNGEEDEELEEKSEIEKRFGVNDLDIFVREQLFPVVEYETKRLSYRNGKVRIDSDETNFGYKIFEIEILVDNKEEIEEARRELIQFARRYGFENQKALPKRREFLRRFNEKAYKEIYGE